MLKNVYVHLTGEEGGRGLFKCIGETEETHEELCQVSRCPDREFNPVPPEHNPGTSPPVLI